MNLPLLGLNAEIPHPAEVLGQINQARCARLNVPAILLLKERLDHLAAFVFADRTEAEAMDFEWGFESNVGNLLDTWEQLQRRAALTEGINGAGS